MWQMEGKVQLLYLGDVAPAGKNVSVGPWVPPADVVPGDESRILFNWELPMGDTTNPVPRSAGPRLMASPDALSLIKPWSPGFAALANNHVLDAGEHGLAYTVESLNKAGFVTVGAGRNREDISKPLIWETSAGRLAVVNWVFPETTPDWMSEPGPNCWPGFAAAERTIGELKRDSDWVTVVVHWSDELFPYPRLEDRDIARHLADMGVDLIVGHHPHVVRGMELIGTCPVFYSLGNFYFSDFCDERGEWLARRLPGTVKG